MVSLKRPALVLLSVFVVFALAASSYGDPRFGVYKGDRPAGPKFVPGEVIVKFKAGVGEVITGAAGGIPLVRLCSANALAPLDKASGGLLRPQMNDLATLSISGVWPEHLIGSGPF